MYIKVFVKIYNWQNNRLIYKTYEMVKFEKYSISKYNNMLSSQLLTELFKINKRYSAIKNLR